MTVAGGWCVVMGTERVGGAEWLRWFGRSCFNPELDLWLLFMSRWSVDHMELGPMMSRYAF